MTSPGPLGSSAILWGDLGLVNQYSGIGYYAKRLHDALLQGGVTPKIIPSTHGIEHGWGDTLAVPNTYLSKWSRFKPLGQWVAAQQLKKFLRQTSLDQVVYHGLSNFNLPSSARSLVPIRKVLTVHDLIPILYPSYTSRSLAAFSRFQFPRVLKAADHIIAVSDWTKRELERLFPFVAHKITVIPNGLDKSMEAGPQQLSSRLNLLTVARGERYKRLDMVVPILAKLLESGICVTWNIVTDVRGVAILTEKMEPRHINHVNLSVGIPDSELAEIYRNTHLYIHPSLFEGFCLPASEAIGRKIPVVFTRGSGIDEVVGRAGLGLQSTDPPEVWAVAIQSITSQYSEYHKLALDQASKAIDWPEVATRTNRVYDIILESS